jgi:hypothetical protein
MRARCQPIMLASSGLAWRIWNSCDTKAKTVIVSVDLASKDGSIRRGYFDKNGEGTHNDG